MATAFQPNAFQNNAFQIIVFSIQVSSVVGMRVGDSIEIMLDEGSFFPTIVTSIIPPNTLTIMKNVPSRASTGNIVLDITQSKKVRPDNEDFLT